MTECEWRSIAVKPIKALQKMLSFGLACLFNNWVTAGGLFEDHFLR